MGPLLITQNSHMLLVLNKLIQHIQINTNYKALTNTLDFPTSTGQVSSHREVENSRQDPDYKDAASLITKLIQFIFYLILLLHLCITAMSYFVKTSHNI